MATIETHDWMGGTYMEDLSGGIHGHRLRQDRRYWMAWARVDRVTPADCHPGVTDDFGNLTPVPFPDLPSNFEDMTMTKNDLQAKHIEAMRAVANGADVWAYGTAVDLREVQRAAPELITIGRAMMAPADGAKQQPYFGAILTDAGREFVGLTAA